MEKTPSPTALSSFGGGSTSLSELTRSSSAGSFSSPPELKPEPPALAVEPEVELPKDEGWELEEVNFVDHEYFDSFPPGYRFTPYDDELLEHYLAKKVLGQPVPMSKIMEVNLYKYNPETLAAKYKHCGENEWYFFTPRDRKYKHGKRPNRRAGDGYWKATGADKVVRTRKGVKVGYKKALVFYQGNAPKGAKTNWIMHEYRVEEHPSPRPRAFNGVDDMRLDDYVLCRIYKKLGNGSIRRTPRQREDFKNNFSVDHEDADYEPRPASIIDQTDDHYPTMDVDNKPLHPHFSHHFHGEENNLSLPVTQYANQMLMETSMEMHMSHFGRSYYPPQQQQQQQQQNFVDDNLYITDDLWRSSHDPFEYDHHHVIEDFHDQVASFPQQQHHGTMFGR